MDFSRYVGLILGYVFGHYLDKLPLGFVLGFGYVFGVFLGSVFPFGFVLVLNSLFWLLLLCFCLVLTLIGLDIF